MRTGGADRKRGLAHDKEWLAIVLIPIVLVVVIIILLRRMVGIARVIGLTLLLVVIGFSIIGNKWHGIPLWGLLLIYLVLLSLLLPIYGMYRAARDEKWPWFWAILGTTFLATASPAQTAVPLDEATLQGDELIDTPSSRTGLKSSTPGTGETKKVKKVIQYQ